MNIKFTDPCPDGVLEGSSFLNKSKLKYETKKGGKILSPYNGVITKSGNDYVVIKHNINGEEWESKLKDFRVTVDTNQKVMEGKQIGFTLDGTFTFDVNPNVNANDLITIGVNPSKYNGKSIKDDDDNLGRNKSNSSDDPLKGVLKMFLSPVTFVQGALNLNKHSKLSEQEVNEKLGLIKEDITRMKKLF